MAESIDSLQIDINASAVKANEAIDRLVGKLDRLTVSLGKIDGSKISGLANGVNRLSTAMQAMNNTKTTDFNRLSKNLTKLGNVNVSALNSAASSMSQLTRAFGSLGTVSVNAQAVGNMAKNIAKLGNANVRRAITNIPQLATAMDNLMTTLSRSPQVSQNIIDMTNALARLSSQGSKLGSASNSIASGLSSTSSAAKNAKKSFGGLASAIGKFYQRYFYIIRAIKGLFKSIEGTADYIESYNYFNVAIGKIGKDWSYQWEQYGYKSAEAYAESFETRLSESISKLSGLNIEVYADGKGLLTESGMKNLGLNIQEVTQYASQLASVTNSIGQTGEVSLAVSSAFTKLSGDISSLFNVSYSSVAKNLQSGLIGQSRALYKYGIDITNATLQTYAYELGLSKAVSEMTQAEKMQLRMLAILDQSKVSWGDLANTINSPSNMLRQFTNNLKETSMALGQIFVPVLQRVMPVVNGVVIAIKRLLVSVAQLLGVKIDLEAFGQGYTDIEDEFDDISGSIDDATGSAKKFKQQLQGFDELNLLTSQQDTGSSTVGTGTIDLTEDILKAASEYENAWNEAFEKMENKANEYADKIKGFFAKIFEPLKEWGSKVNWKKLGDGLDAIYNFAKKFTKNVGKGFLNFIQGLSDIGAPIINTLGDAFKILFGALNLVPASVWQALGGALGGLLTVFLGFKGYLLIASGINNAIVGFTTALKNISVIKLADLSKNLGSLSTVIANLGLGGKIALAAGAIGAVTGAIIALKEAYDDSVEDFVNASVFDGLGTSIGTVGEEVINLLNSTGTSSESIKIFTDGLQNIKDRLNDANEELELYMFKLDNTSTLSNDDIGSMQTSINNLVSTLKDELQYNSDMVWGAFQTMSEDTAKQLGIDVETMTTILSQFNQKFSGMYDDMQSEADELMNKMLNGNATEADIERLRQITGDLQYLSADAIKKQIEFQNSLEDWKNINFEDVDAVTKVIGEIAETGTQRIEEVDAYYQSLIDQASCWKETTKRALEIGKITPEEAEFCYDWLSTMTDVYNKNWESERQTIQNQVDTAYQYIRSQLEKAGVELYQDAENKEYSLIDLILGAHPTDDAIKSFNKNIYEPLLEEMNNGRELIGLEAETTGKTLWNSFMDAVEEEALNTNNITKKTTEKIAKNILNSTDAATSAFAEMAGYSIDGYTQGIDNNIPKLKRSLTDFGEHVVDYANKSLDINSPSKKFEKMGLYSVMGFNQGISQNTSKTLSAIATYMNNAISKFSELINPLAQIGKEAMRGLYNGLTSMESTLYGKAQEIANNIAKTIKTALDIHSPSRVMFELGDYTMQGFKNGLENLYNPILSSLKTFSVNLGVAPAPNLESVYKNAQYAYANSYVPQYNGMGYYERNYSQDNSETNALLKELLVAVREGKTIEVNGKVLGETVKKESDQYYKRTGKSMFQY